MRARDLQEMSVGGDVARHDDDSAIHRVLAPQALAGMSQTLTENTRAVSESVMQQTYLQCLTIKW
jgi:hypothetical protein